MKTETIIKFYNDNNPENVRDYLNHLIDNIKEMSRVVYSYLVYLILIILIYYLLQKSTLTSLSFGIIEITDLRIVKIFIPPIFAIIYLVVFIGEYRREHLMHQAKVLLNMTNKTELKPDDLERHYFNDFNISYLPFYLPAELSHKLSTNKFWDIIGVFILFIFYFVLGGALYIFEFYILKQLFALWNESFLVKAVFIITCSIVFLSFFFFFKIAFSKQLETNQDKEFWRLKAKELNDE